MYKPATELKLGDQLLWVPGGEPYEVFGSPNSVLGYVFLITRDPSDPDHVEVSAAFPTSTPHTFGDLAGWYWKSLEFNSRDLFELGARLT